MSKARIAAACAALSSALAFTPDAAAEPMTHDGFYLSMQAGLGYLSTTAEFMGSEATYSGATFSGGLLMGGTVGPVVIGGGFTYDNAFSPSYEAEGVSGDVEGLSLYLISFTAFVDVYPDPTEGLHIIGLLGWGGLEASYEGNVSGSDPTGLLFGVGAGYDFWLADEWSIGPLGRLTYAPLSRDDVSFSTIQFTAVADFKFH